jgi:hypothetical protein
MVAFEQPLMGAGKNGEEYPHKADVGAKAVAARLAVHGGKATAEKGYVAA